MKGLTQEECEMLSHKLARALFWNGESPICVDNEEVIKEILLQLNPVFPFVEYQTI